jgi:lipoprotein-releasing system permease protein
MTDPATEVVVLRTLAAIVGAGLVVVAIGTLLFAGVETFRRAGALPLAVRYASSRLINVVSVLGVAVGVAALIIVLSVMNGFISEQRRLIRGSLADLTIQPQPLDSNGGNQMPGRFEQYVKALEGTPHLVALAPRFVWYALLIPSKEVGFLKLSREGASNAVELRGIDPALERNVSEFSRWIGPIGEDETGVTPSDRLFYKPVRDPKDPFQKLSRGGLPKEAIIVGISLARKLRLRRDQRVELVTWSPNSTREHPVTPNMEFDVAGMFHTQEQAFDAHTALVTIPALQKFLSENEADFTEIAVKLDDYRHASAARGEIAKRLAAAGLLQDDAQIPAHYQILTWEEQRENLLAAVDNERSILGVILFFIVILAAAILFATLSMMVTEKTRDVGILSTLGASWQEILTVFVDVGAAMTIAGEILGLGLALLVSANLDSIERFLDERFGLRLFNPDIYYLKSLPSEVDPSQVAVILVLTLVTGTLASLIPAIRASRLDPAQALRYE